MDDVKLKMARRAMERLKEAERVADGKPKKKRAVSGTSDAAFETAKAETEEALEDGDWTFAAPRHFVALYVLLHEQVYGVTPVELTPKFRTVAAGFVKKLLDREFGGDRALFAEYMRWVWIREEKQHAWRKANGREGRRIGWYLCFAGSLVTDWRLANPGK
jgi:hypothetical protein